MYSQQLLKGIIHSLLIHPQVCSFLSVEHKRRIYEKSIFHNDSMM